MEFSPKAGKELLICWIVDAFLRTIVHYGYWLKEVEYQYGMGVTLEIEKEVGETSFAIQLNRLAKLLNIELQNGMPAVLYRIDEKQLVELLDTLSLNWLANDGVWFQAVIPVFRRNAWDVLLIPPARLVLCVAIFSSLEPGCEKHDGGVATRPLLRELGHHLLVKVC